MWSGPLTMTGTTNLDKTVDVITKSITLVPQSVVQKLEYNNKTVTTASGCHYKLSMTKHINI